MPPGNKNPQTTKKHLMFFTGCPAHLGCTILLRGGDQQELQRVKNVVKYMVFVLYNWKFERSYLVQERAFIAPHVKEAIINLDEAEQQQRRRSSSSQEVVSTPTSPSMTGEEVIDNSDPLRSVVPVTSNETVPGLIVDSIIQDTVYRNSFRQALNDVVICSSPYIKKAMPFLETDQGKLSPLRKYFPRVLFYSKLIEQSQLPCKDNIGDVKQTSCEIGPVNIHNDVLNLEVFGHHPLVNVKFLTNASEHAKEIAMADFRAAGGQLCLTAKCTGLEKGKHQASGSVCSWDYSDTHCCRGCSEEVTLMPWRLHASTEAKKVITLKQDGNFFI